MASTAPLEVSEAGSSAFQARACQVCADSKAKYIRRAEGETEACERCKRMKKACLPGRIAPRKVRRPRTNQTAQLAQKLDSLVSMLVAGQTAPDTAAELISPDPPGEAVTRKSANPDAHGWTNHMSATLPLSTAATARIPDKVFPHPSWRSSVDDQLHAFRTRMAPYFPFVIVHPGTTADELRSSKPLLYDSIMMVMSYRNVSQQSKMRAAVIKTCTDQIFIHGKKSLELLQSILVFAAWYHHHLSPSPQLTNMVQLATALVFELGFHRTQPPLDRDDTSVESLQGFRNRWMSSPRALDERRAFLGLFCLSRGLAANIGKIEPLQATPYVEECCVEIVNHQEYASDQYLLFLVRFQKVADIATLSFPSHGVDYWSELGTEPIAMLVNSFQKDLERFKDSLDSQGEFNTLIQIHLCNIAIHNTYIALRKSVVGVSLQETSNPTRLKLLMTCLESTKTFFADWLSLPSNLYHCLPMTVFAFVAHAAIVLGTLNFFQCDGWDLEHVRQLAAFSPTLDSLAQKYEEASRETDDGGHSGTSAFCREGFKMKRLKDWYESRLPGPVPPEQSAGGTLGLNAWFDFDFSDERLWLDAVGPTEYGDASWMTTQA